VKHHNMIRTASIAFLTALSVGSAFAAEGTSTSSNRAMTPGDGRSELLPEIGIYGGGARTAGDQYQTDGSFMAEVGFTPFAPFNLALQAQYSPATLDIPFADISFNTTNVLLKETVSLGLPGQFMSNFYIGTKTGVAIYSGDATDTTTNLALGGTLGFDIPLMASHNVTLGAEGTYLAVVSGQDEVRTPDQISALGAVKYWF